MEIINPKFYLRKLIDIFRFIIFPTQNKEENPSIFFRLKSTLVILIIGFLLASISIFLMNTFIHGLPISKRTFKLLQDYPVYIVLFYACFLAPILEETIFRLSLIYKPLFLSITLSVAGFILLNGFIFKKLNHTPDYFIIYRVIVFFFILLSWIYITTVPQINNNLNRFWKRNFRLIFYCSCILFGWFHITNYDLTLNTILLMPLLTLPQLLIGITTGYVRIKYGFIYSFLAHSLNNLIPMIIYLSLKFSVFK